MALSEGRKYAYNVNKFRERTLEIKKTSSKISMALPIRALGGRKVLKCSMHRIKNLSRGKFSLDTDHYERFFAQQVISWAQLY